VESCRTARLDEPAARLAGCGEMIQITAQMRVLVAIEPVDGRKGMDSLARLCQEKLAEDPFSGCVFVFRSRGGTAIRLLSYDGQGYWLAQELSTNPAEWMPCNYRETLERIASLSFTRHCDRSQGVFSRFRKSPLVLLVTPRCALYHGRLCQPS
jgi:transposase